MYATRARGGKKRRSNSTSARGIRRDTGGVPKSRKEIIKRGGEAMT